jgi:hypothetical protein
MSEHPSDFGRKTLRMFSDVQAFGRWFAGDSWRPWLALLHGLFGVPPDDTELAALQHQVTERAAPTMPASTGVLVIGRGGGKSLISSFIACAYALRDYSAYLAPGERATIMLIAADRRQARVLMRYVRGFFDALPMLGALVERETADGLDLKNASRSRFTPRRSARCAAIASFSRLQMRSRTGPSTARIPTARSSPRSVPRSPARRARCCC